MGERINGRGLLSACLLLLAVPTAAQTVVRPAELATDSARNSPVNPLPAPSTHKGIGTFSSAQLDQKLELQTFEDNYVGRTKDSDDEGFMEFRLSVTHEFEIVDRLVEATKLPIHLTFNFAFTGRFAQYIGTRTSSPVVGKRFNPYFYFEHRFPANNQNRLRVGYGHESNGQAISDPASFATLVSSIVPSKRGPDPQRQALDYISRGWDYIGVSWTSRPAFGRDKWAYEVATRYYLNRGFFEGPKEEYLPWESAWYGQQFSRNEVSGLAGAVEYDPGLPILHQKWLTLSRLKLLGVTGISPKGIGQNWSGKVTAVVNVFDLAITTSYAAGYDGDIAQFGKQNHSWSLGLTLNAFKAPLALTGGGLN